jgi:hypothetical protein
MPEQEIQTPTDMLNKLSTALVMASRGDPLTALRGEFETKINSILSRFDAIDKATELQHQDMVRVPTQVDKAVAALRDVLVQMMKTNAAEVFGEIRKHISETSEKFAGVTAKFLDVATRTDQRAGDIKLAVDAAFAAAKETTAKIEAGFTKQIDAMIAIIDTKTGNLQAGLADLKDNNAAGLADVKVRLTALESRAGTVTEVRRETRDDRTDTRSNMTLIIGGAMFVIGLAALFLKTQGLH